MSIGIDSPARAWSICGQDEHTLRAEELSRNVEGFTSDNYNLLAVEQLLGDGTGQATEKMSLAIDHDLEMEERRQHESAEQQRYPACV